MTAIVAAWLFYIGFAASISVYRLWTKSVLNLWNKVLFAPVLLLFFIIDVALNFTLMVLLFGAPPAGCFTISARLESYHKTESTPFKKVFATFVCEKLLNPIDPNGSHC